MADPFACSLPGIATDSSLDQGTEDSFLISVLCSRIHIVEGRSGDDYKLLSNLSIRSHETRIIVSVSNQSCIEVGRKDQVLIRLASCVVPEQS